MKVIKGSWYILGLTVLVNMGCIEHRPNENSNAVVNEQKEKAFIAEKTFKGLRIYEGKIPCADCDAIEQRLVMKGDTMGIYRLTEVYKNATEDGDAVLVSTGEWKRLFVDEKRKQKQFYLSQGHIKDSARVVVYNVGVSGIKQLYTPQNGADSLLKYELKLKKYVQ